MKTVIFSCLFFFAVIAAHPGANKQLFENSLDTFLQNGLKHKTASLIESLYLSEASGKVDNKEESFSFDTRAVVEAGLKDLELLAAKTDLERFSIDIHFRVPTILLQGDYEVDGQQKSGGKGFFELKANEVLLHAKATLNKRGGIYQARGITVSHTNKGIASYFARLSENSGTLSETLADVVFSEYVNQINIHLAKSLTSRINNLIQVHYQGRAEIGNANAYIDQVLILVREKIMAEGLDRIPLTNISIGFSQDVWLIGNVHGECGLYNGVLGGFETLHRIKDDATFDFNNPVITVNATVGMNNGLLGYMISITFMDIGPQATLTGTLSYANIFFEAQILLEPLTVTITQFDIQEIGHIDIQIEGLEPFNWLADIIVGTVINTVKGVIKEIIEGPIRRIMEWALNEYVSSILNPAPAVAASAIRLAL